MISFYHTMIQATPKGRTQHKFLQAKGYYEKNKLFYKTTPSIITEEMNRLFLKQLSLIGTDGPKFYLKDRVNSLSNGTLEHWKLHHISLAKEPSLLGISEHGLYIGKKVVSL